MRNWLYKKRKEKGLSQQEVADFCREFANLIGLWNEFSFIFVLYSLLTHSRQQENVISLPNNLHFLSIQKKVKCYLDFKNTCTSIK